MTDAFRLTATEAAARIRAGALSPVDLVEACLARIDAIEPQLQAWVAVDADGARQAARERLDAVRTGRPLGPLHGVPVGLKDIYHARGFVTTCGAGPFFHERPDADATTVARLRGAGAIVLGKATTTEFASRDPAPTRNPWNLAHTPGGSSSGSAAAVSAGMVPLALGSQTVGSTLRPAAYCGIVGLKPTHGRVSASGIVPLAWSFDTVGIFGRDVADVALCLSVLAGYDAGDPASVDVPVPDYLRALSDTGRAPRLGLPRRWIARTEPETAAHVLAVADRCKGAGAIVEDVDLPASIGELPVAGQRVMHAEAAAFHRTRFPAHADRYQEKFRATLAAGIDIPARDYVPALRHCRQFRRDLEPLLARFDAILSPVAPGTAPRGIDFTGDAAFCAPWSYAGVPAIALPSGIASSGLPLGVQLSAGPWQEPTLLATAQWVERVLAFRGEPSFAA